MSTSRYTSRSWGLSQVTERSRVLPSSPTRQSVGYDSTDSGSYGRVVVVGTGSVVVVVETIRALTDRPAGVRVSGQIADSAKMMTTKVMMRRRRSANNYLLRGSEFSKASGHEEEGRKRTDRRSLMETST